VCSSDLNAPVEAIRRQAESVLKQAIAVPENFGTLARQFSNCPSSAQEGSLGQLTRGETVPEFERAVFDSEATGVLPRLVCTRYGFHVVRVARRLPGNTVDFETAAPHIAARLRAHVRAKAAEQYVRVLAARARITGVDLGAVDSPLLQ
jgi:peptidyl-prolyl cis-trans isomerase C